MILGGLQKLSLVDFPNKLACTVFTVGCNLRCPFCHNALLVNDGSDRISEDDFFAFLQKRQHVIEGVCITGGEPLIQKDIIPFIFKIKELGFALKLDTNGFMTDVLREIVNGKYVDYIAMDIKTTFEKYPIACGIKSHDGNFADNYKESAKILMSSDIPFEFRTTVVNGIHTPEDFSVIGKALAGDESYFLQIFKNSGNLIDESGLSSPSDEMMYECLAELKKYVPNTKIRGL